jgi:thiol-disulfide isomerase/thioredoxin
MIPRRSVVIAISMLLPLVACSQIGQAPSPHSPSIEAVGVASEPLLPSYADELPSFNYAMFEALGAQLDGTPVVVNIWSSWCGPCVKEAPRLAAAAERYSRRVQFIGVDIRDARGAAQRFIEHYAIPYPNLFDPAGEIRDRLGFVGQPETLFYDVHGNVVSTWIGAVPPDELRRRLAEILV